MKTLLLLTLLFPLSGFGQDASDAVAKFQADHPQDHRNYWEYNHPDQYPPPPAAVHPQLPESQKPLALSNGAVVPGKVVQVIPARVQIQTDKGTLSLNLDQFSPASQSKILGRRSDAEQIVYDRALDDAEKNLICTLATQLKEYAPSDALDQLLATNGAVPKVAATPAPQPAAAAPTEPGEMPADIIQQIKDKAAQDFPGDPTTQLYVVKGNIDAWKDLQAFPASDVKAKASTDYPLDFTTQIYVVKKAVEDQSELQKY